MRSRPALVGGLVVAFVVVLAAAGIYAVQTAQDSALCSAVPSPAQCLGISSVQTATNAVYASVAGLLMATVMAVAVGLNVGIGPKPNSQLAKSLDSDEHHLEEYRARRAQLDEWTVMAKDRAAAARAARAEMKAQAAAAADTTFEAEAARWVQEEAGEEEAQESDAQRRGRFLAEHLAQLASAKPEAVAAVLSGWINQPNR